MKIPAGTFLAAVLLVLPFAAGATIVDAMIDIEKEVSVDGGVTFFDADDGASAPVISIGGDALYRLSVANPGSDDLENVLVNDNRLGIVDFLLGPLAIDQTVVLTSGEIPALDQPGIAVAVGDLVNVATVDANPVGYEEIVSDADAAVVRIVSSPSVPEPTTLLLLGLGLAGLGFARRRLH